MAVGIESITVLPVIGGVRVAATGAGIRYQERDDLVLFEFQPGTQVAAVFTQNRFCAAPVTVARRHLEETPARYLLINAGNANAGTGMEGVTAAEASCSAVAELAGVDAEAVLPFSTGVIGEHLPVDRIDAALPDLFADLAEDHWVRAAHAIMTTDTVAKGASRQMQLQNRQVSITGIVKGAGMIRPNMATMLCFIATDAAIPHALLQRWVTDGNEQSFSCVTVDGDTSTNDACVVAATGASGVVLDDETDPDARQFRDALHSLMRELAQAMIRDGEGATKFVTIAVEGADGNATAKEIAYTVAHSPLVKTALFASDPNWGRILAAVGRSPVEVLDISAVDIWLGDVAVIRAGEPAPEYTEAQGQAAMDRDEINIRIRIGDGSGRATIWTSDLSYDYVKINADYRS
ncbi:MAG TPA: bifunctional glutamate N-acetyltransferase/amino-acid acetyltransferase ArgJ [Gammaproteobacteria bacterium]|nr:bifunctional glutamate N-acetyltransferase/amino-acid acetyltransferase ArgJ [Gammaproteobacteria bacterium]